MAIVIPDPDATKKAKAIFLGADFGRAFCEHFGLPAGQVLKVAPHADRDEIMHAKVEIALTAEDLAGIAAIMGGAKTPEAPRLDRLPVVSMDLASGPDQTAIRFVNRCPEPASVTESRTPEGTRQVVIEHIARSLTDPNSKVVQALKGGAEFVRRQKMPPATPAAPDLYARGGPIPRRQYVEYAEYGLSTGYCDIGNVTAEDVRSGNEPASEDPMEATRALVKKHGGGSGG